MYTPTRIYYYIWPENGIFFYSIIKTRAAAERFYIFFFFLSLFLLFFFSSFNPNGSSRRSDRITGYRSYILLCTLHMYQCNYIIIIMSCFVVVDMYEPKRSLPRARFRVYRRKNAPPKPRRRRRRRRRCVKSMMEKKKKTKKHRV